MTAAPVASSANWSPEGYYGLAGNGGAPTPAAQARAPRSALGIIGAAVRGIGARVSTGRRASAAAGWLFDLAAAGMITFGAFQAPGAWGDVGGWLVGGLSAMIVSAKLDA